LFEKYVFSKCEFVKYTSKDETSGRIEGPMKRGSTRTRDRSKIRVVIRRLSPTIYTEDSSMNVPSKSIFLIYDFPLSPADPLSFLE